MALGDEQERHRPGLLKQQNKAHKHGRHRSKGALDTARKGRVNIKTLTKRVHRDLRKHERRNQAVQIRQKKRDEVLFKKRCLGSSHAPPFLTAVVPLSYEIDPHGALALLKTADDEAVITHGSEGSVHISVPRFRQRFSFVIPGTGDLYSILDTLKVADTVLFLMSAATSKGIDPEGELILASCMAQGLPSSVVAITDLESLHPKKRHDAKKELQKVISRWLPDIKLISLEKDGDGLTLLRCIGGQKQRSVMYRDRRPHVLADSVEYICKEEGTLGTLKVSGYVRGVALSVNSLVHIPGWGSYQMSLITASEDPHPLMKNGQGSRNEEEMSDGKERILAKPNPDIQASLVSENIPDPMEGEQTWPTEEELQQAEERIKKKVKRIPKGMSEYQAAWIPDSDEELSVSEDEDSGDEMMEAESEKDSDNEAEEDNEQDLESVTISEYAGDAQRYDEKMDMTEEEEALQKLKDAHTDQMFPDEVDTPQDTPASIRFQKYRGLKSFRTSPWDPKENLPIDYAKIFQFENFDRTRKRVLKATNDEEGTLPGCYVTVYVNDVPKELVEFRRRAHPLILYGMLPHEQKMSVLNVVLKRPTMLSTQEPIKSKEQLIFHVGYRRFKACPIFSQHTNGTKHKYERYFQPDATVVATVFAPIIFPPCPVLVFKEKKDGTQDLVAVGSVLSVNPDRIVAKRLILSGHPFKVHKRSSVIRFMFFNREDIEWFKPVELRTKYGRHGHIKEPLGTHGHMKCVFDGQLKSQDTVLMCLYKRVFPKWTYDPCLDSPSSLYSNLTYEEEMK